MHAHISDFRRKQLRLLSQARKVTGLRGEKPHDFRRQPLRLLSQARKVIGLRGEKPHDYYHQQLRLLSPAKSRCFMGRKTSRFLSPATEICRQREKSLVCGKKPHDFCR